MSTNAIRRLINDVAEEFGMERCREALAEVVAIEKAAQDLKKWNDNGGRGIDLDAARGFDLLERIAKEAT